ncbi:MAG TPA: UDP-N-acetylmuramate dehydrogenase [Polyangiaceae bacterium]|nr:UDP-N-acetylmuramate dehydrogenase [Polyangiaceae bacterium]
MITQPLAPLTTLGLGGPAREFVRATTEAEILSAVERATAHELPLYPLGGGSNLVVADEGVEGLVLAIDSRGIDFHPDGDGVLVTAAAGEPWDAFTELLCARGWAGVECLGGIPGKVGATPIQNVGAYGQEVSDVVVSVRALERSTLRVVELDRQACAFAYRDSFFKREGKDRFVVLSVTFRLSVKRSSRPDYPELARALGRAAELVSPEEARRAVIELRRQKSMVLDPCDENARSCGSFFVNPRVTAEQLAYVATVAGGAPPAFPDPSGLIKLPAAWLIERAGLQKGMRHGAVGLSSRHTLALVAHRGATARQVVDFARFVQATVREVFRVQLEPEPNFWGFAGVEPGHLPAAAPGEAPAN